MDAPPNLLLIVADDVGVDQVSAYREAPSPPPTPTLDALAAEGVLFRNAYANPLCSTTRAALLTGRYSRRHGVGAVLDVDDSTWELPLAEVLLPEALERGGVAWDTAALGKWHLASHASASSFRHPLLQGFDRYAGSFANLPARSRDWGARGNYEHWEKVVDGTPTWRERYATTDTADDAIAELGRLREPWFLYVGFNAAHEPFHAPPPGLAGRTLDREDPVRERYRAMVTALDHEIGRVLSAMDPAVRARTWVVVVGDNGTPPTVVDPPFGPERAKGTVWEGGTNVPLVVTGPGVVPGEAGALVHAVDVMPTLLELAGVPIEGLVLDGVSFAPVLASPGLPGTRRYVYVERFSPSGPGPYRTDSVAVRDQRYKLVRRDGVLELYDLKDRPAEGRPLRRLTPEQQEVQDRLRAELERCSSLRFEYDPVGPGSASVVP